MAVYEVQRFIWELDRDRAAKARFRADPDSLLNQYRLNDHEKRVLRDVDAWALRDMDVHPILIRQYTRLFEIPHHEIFTKSPHYPFREDVPPPAPAGGGWR
jgi:hypothetical protein